MLIAIEAGTSGFLVKVTRTNNKAGAIDQKYGATVLKDLLSIIEDEVKIHQSTTSKKGD